MNLTSINEVLRLAGKDALWDINNLRVNISESEAIEIKLIVIVRFSHC